MEKVAFDQRHEGNKKVSHMDAWGRAFERRREQSKDPEWACGWQVWVVAGTPARLKPSVPG